MTNEHDDRWTLEELDLMHGLIGLGFEWRESDERAAIVASAAEEQQ